MRANTRLACAILLFVAGLVVFFIGITNKDTNTAACVIDTFLAGGLMAPFLILVNIGMEEKA